jgi:hypothetical protein
MSVSELWTICALKIGSTVLGQITEQEVADNLQEEVTGDSGGVFDRGSTIMRQDSRIRITTEMVKTGLATLGSTGVALTSGNKATVYFQKYAAGGLRQAGQCVGFEFAGGLVVPRQLAAEGGKLATLSLEVVPISDGVNAPFTKLTAQAIPTLGAVPEMYTAGGTDGVQGLSVDFGIQEQLVYGDGLAWPTFVAVEKAALKATLRRTTMGTLGPAAVPVLYLYQRSQGGYVGNGVISMTFAQARAAARRIGGRPALTETEILATYDGTNAPVVFAGLA